METKIFWIIFIQCNLGLICFYYVMFDFNGLNFSNKKFSDKIFTFQAYMYYICCDQWTSCCKINGSSDLTEETRLLPEITYINRHMPRRVISQ